MYSYVLKIPMYLGLLVLLCLASCKKNGSDNQLVKGSDTVIKDRSLVDQLKIKPGQSVDLDIPLDDLCSFLGDPSKDCREQSFASDHGYFRIYPAIRNRYPAVIITKVGRNKREKISPDGASGFLLASLNRNEESLQTVSVNRDSATVLVKKFRRYFPTAPQIWTVNYNQLLDLFSTTGQWVPEGQEPIRNHLNLKFTMQQDHSLDMALNTCFGNAVIGKFYLGDYLPVWIDVCPGQCGPDAQYFLPANS